jgi:hypothetical protein
MATLIALAALCLFAAGALAGITAELAWPSAGRTATRPDP